MRTTAVPAGGHPGVSRGLERLSPLLRRCPRPLADTAFVSAALADALVRSGRYGRARAWALSRGLRGPACERLTLALLANHGRFVVDELLLPLMPDAELRDRMPIDGRQHLDALRGSGAILLLFHLGPPGAWRAVRAHGFPVYSAVRGASALHRGEGSDPRDRASTVPFDDGDATGRVASLFRMRRLLSEGALVALAGDGPFGHEAFRIDVEGTPLIIRRGWLALRRTGKWPVLPVLVHRERRGRAVVHVHPPLPRALDDERDDQAVCRDALALIVRDFVSRYPSQCRWLAMPHWSTAMPAQEPGRP